MREHQISVNLKPQQFELLQRLAREKGYKSVSAYVREKIVELAMNLEPAGDKEVGGAGAQAFVDAKLVKDLERIHEELRHFVQESLGAVVEGSLPVESTDMDSKVKIERADDIQVREDVNRFEGQAIPRSNLGGFGFGLGGLGAMFGERSGGRAGGAGLLGGGDRLSGYREILDDLEELADRAFSISPRLGSIEEETKPESGQDKEVAATALPVLEEIPLEMVSVVPPVDVNALSVELTLPEVNEVSNVDDAVAAIADIESSAAPPGPVEPVAVSQDEPAVISQDESAVTSQPEPAVTSQPEPAAVSQDESESRFSGSEEVPIPVPEHEMVAMAEDDLLSDLLDNELIALSQAPRTENPFVNLASPGFVFTPEVSAAQAVDIPEQQEIPELQDSQAQQPSLEPFGSLEEEELTPESGMGALADSLELDGAANVNKTSSDDDKTAKPDGVVKGSPQGGESQDVSSGGVSGLSGGPPPKRRRT
ncbi:MAG: hypothetical protein K2Y32_11715 [Candidatus Obscuribacterales bacterium]|nr:hypothetical protein [Candidatus Obscuribacterales bacterium]